MPTESEYPTELDDFGSPFVNQTDTETGEENPTDYDGKDGSGEGVHAAHHNLLSAALTAIETELGITPSGAEDSVADRLTAIEAAIALKQDSAGAATDAELTKAVEDLTTLIGAKQDASSAATDTELAAEKSAREEADETLITAVAGKQASLGFTPADVANLDTDAALAANSDAKWASQKATKAYVDGLLAASDAVAFKGVIDCSTNPNYPAASAGHLYRVSVAGKIGGGSGVNVEVGDTLLCNTDGAAEGTHAAVGSKWNVIQVNVDGAVVGPASAVDGHLVAYDGTTGKLVKDGGLSSASFDAAGLAAAEETRAKGVEATKANLVEGKLKESELPAPVVSSSRYNAETEEWEPRPSANVVVFSSTDKEAATPGDIQAGDLIVRASE